MGTTLLTPATDLQWTKEDAKDKFANLAEILKLESKSREEFYKDLETKYKGITAIYRHNDSARGCAARRL